MAKITVIGKRVQGSLQLTLRGELDGSTVFEILNHLKNLKGVKTVEINDHDLIVEPHAVKMMEKMLPRNILGSIISKKINLDPDWV